MTQNTIEKADLAFNLDEEVESLERIPAQVSHPRGDTSPHSTYNLVDADGARVDADIFSEKAKLDSFILSASREELVMALGRAQEKLESNKFDLDGLAVHRHHLEHLIALIVSSKSWKLTAPLRRLVDWKKKWFPLWKRSVHTLSLGPLRHIKQEGDSFVPTGVTPELLLRSDKNELPGGMFLLSGSLVAKNPGMHFLLYYSEGKDFGGDKRVWLSFETGKPIFLRLPLEVKNLRIDPFNADGGFHFSSLTAKELGSMQAYTYIALKRLLPLIKNPRLAVAKFRKLVAIFKESGFTGLKLRLIDSTLPFDYGAWVSRYDTLSDDDRNKIQHSLTVLPIQPMISVLMPVYNTPEKWLRKAIDSVLKQQYKNWELCLADDCSTAAHVRRVIDEYVSSDDRIKAVFRKENGHISVASNSALELATGEYVSLLDHDDELTEDALYQVVYELNQHPEAQMFYSDEDKISEAGERFNPYFKSDWNHDLYLQQNYICHLATYKTDRVRDLGGFRKGVEGAQDWDLALRVIDTITPEKIRHIPHVLYHWRVIEGSTAQSTGFKPYVLEAQKKTVEDHLKRIGLGESKVTIRQDISHVRVVFPLPEKQPLVSLIIPTKDQVHLLKICVESILDKTNYKNFEIIIVDNGSKDPATHEYFSQLAGNGKIKIVQDTKPFNFSRLNNDAAKNAAGELLGLVNNDIEVISSNWLSELVSMAIRPQTGAVGARLLYPSNLLQHAGVILGIGGIAGHNLKGRRKEDPGYFNKAILNQNFSAVTAACLVLRKEIYEEVGGLNETDFSVAFNDIDFCLRIREKGYDISYCGYAELYHHESASRGYETTPEKFARFEREVENMKRIWGRTLMNDPFYNPNLTLLSEDYAYSFPPRAIKPWKYATKHL